MIDVRLSLKRRKRIALSPQKHVYACFQYKNLMLFYFICGKLGHSESFYPVWIDHGAKELPMGWDITLKALPHQALPHNSIWLREVGNLSGQSSGIVSNRSIYAPRINSTSNFVKMISNCMGLNLGGVADRLKEDAMDKSVQDHEGIEVMGIFHWNHRWRRWMGIKGKGFYL
ncbi:hypothetical protein J1N35_007496 [Gossypium stocksii]|uniref:Zinc knuckle CX2CX4HX4C domain-containing protein n=1 Tax=Gossypium stocksii TaxID=47602 RepID=A0A9D4AFM1_9ROSI|nr:hypothetical protein J1N35_007496 [Gossypium stocksii]